MPRLDSPARTSRQRHCPCGDEGIGDGGQEEPAAHEAFPPQSGCRDSWWADHKAGDKERKPARDQHDLDGVEGERREFMHCDGQRQQMTVNDPGQLQLGLDEKRHTGIGPDLGNLSCLCGESLVNGRVRPSPQRRRADVRTLTARKQPGVVARRTGIVCHHHRCRQRHGSCTNHRTGM